jgi:hypothetical protein
MLTTALARGRSPRGPRSKLEAIVQAAADNVLVERDGACSTARTGKAGAAEIDVKVFGLDRPVAGEGVLNSGTGGPA